MAQEKFTDYYKDVVRQNPERLSRGFSLTDAVREYDRFSN